MITGYQLTGNIRSCLFKIRHYVVNGLVWGVLVLGSVLSTYGQKPIQVTPVLRPPYTLQLSDYYSTTQEKLVLILTNRDLNKPVLNVRLRMTVEGQGVLLSNRIFSNLPTLALEAGVPLRLSRSDLEPYFSVDNLDFSGITRSQYAQQPKLPEGFYQFCFEAIEVSTGEVASAKSCASAWMSLSDPPFLNLPRKDEAIAVKANQNIIFQWTPRHLNSPNSAYVTEYDFQLVELWDNNLAPEVAFQSAQPLYETTTRTTTLLYGPSQPLLLAGKRYGWRVRARARQGIEEVDVFRNQGYSEIYSFTYQDVCPPPVGISASPGTYGSVQFSWSASDKHSGYMVSYRQKGHEAATWFDQQASSNMALAYDLQSGKEYEYRVGGFCNTDQPVFSDVYTLKVPAREDPSFANCSLVPDANITNKQPKQKLIPGEVITAGNFPVSLTHVTGGGSFSGDGYVTVPFLGRAKVRVTFSNIQVNTENQLIGGTIITRYDADEGSIADVDEAADIFRDYAGIVSRVQSLTIDIPADELEKVLEKLEEKAERELPSVEVDEVREVIRELKETKTKYDEVKAIYDELGDHEPLKKELEKDLEELKKRFDELKNSLGGEDKNAVTAEHHYVVFGPQNSIDGYKNSKYGFDSLIYRPYLDANYDFIKAGRQIYMIPWKSVPLGGDDTVRITTNSTGKPLPKTLNVRTLTGEVKPALLSAELATIKVSGMLEQGTHPMIAYEKRTVDGKDINIEIGKLNVVSYPHLRKKLVIIPVNNANIPGTKVEVQEALNDIYRQAIVEWSVDIRPSLVSRFDEDNNGLDDGVDKIPHNTYTSEMKYIIQDFERTDKILDDTQYIFVVPSSENHWGGYHPYRKAVGFVNRDQILDNVRDFARIVGHELGHGAFCLQHTFDNTAIPKGETINLMDYARDKSALPTLFKYQWDEIHNPSIRLSLFDTNDDNAYKEWTLLDGDVIASIPGYDNKPKSFLSPAGEIITLPPSAKDFTFRHGYLAAFTISDEKDGRYAAIYTKGVDRFNGYVKDGKLERGKDGQVEVPDFTKRYSGLADRKDSVFYVLKIGACGQYEIYKAQPFGTVEKSTLGGIGKNLVYETDAITKYLDPVKTDLVSTVSEGINCLSDRAKELYKFIEVHFTSNGVALDSAYKKELQEVLRDFNSVHIKELDGPPDTTNNNYHVKVREMLKYGHANLLAKIKEEAVKVRLSKDNSKPNVLLVEFEDYKRFQDLFLLYSVAKNAGAYCSIKEHIDKSLEAYNNYWNKAGEIAETSSNPLIFNFRFLTAFFEMQRDQAHELFDFAACVLSQLKAPESTYNPNRFDYDPTKMSEFIKVIKLVEEYAGVEVLKPLRDALPEVTQVEASGVVTVPLKYTTACACGAWNSIVDIVADFPALGAFFTQKPEKIREDFKGIWQAVSTEQGRAMLLNMLKEQHGWVDGYGMDSYQATYAGCYDAMVMMTTVLAVTKIATIIRAVEAGNLKGASKILLDAAKSYPGDVVKNFRDLSLLIARIPIKSTRILLDVLKKMEGKITYLLDQQLNNITFISVAGQHKIMAITPEGIKFFPQPEGTTGRVVYESTEDVIDMETNAEGKLVMREDDQHVVSAIIRRVASPELSKEEIAFVNWPPILDRKNEIAGLKLTDKYPALTEFEITAINYYGGSHGSSDLNKFLVHPNWRDQITNEYIGYALVLNRALGKLPEYKGVVFRGLDEQLSGIFKNFKEGEQIGWRGFQSTSYKQSVAEDFAYGKSGDVILEIEGLRGAPDVSGIVSRANEAEVLIPTNAIFEIQHIEQITVKGEPAFKYKVRFVGYGDGPAMKEFDRRIDDAFRQLENTVERQANLLKGQYLNIFRIDRTPSSEEPLIAKFINTNRHEVATLERIIQGNDGVYTLVVTLPDKTKIRKIQKLTVQNGDLNIDFDVDIFTNEMGLGRYVLEDALDYFTNPQRGFDIRSVTINGQNENITPIEIWKDLQKIRQALSKGSLSDATVTKTAILTADKGFTEISDQSQASKTSVRFTRVNSGEMLTPQEIAFQNLDIVQTILKSNNVTSLKTHYPTLSALELTSIRYYGGMNSSDVPTGSGELNMTLSRPESRNAIPDHIMGHALLLEKALKKLPDVNQTVYSGLSEDFSYVIKDFKVGEQIGRRAFISSSKDMQIASNFMQRGNGSVILEIETPKGAPDISKLVAAENESEVLIPRNAIFEIVEIEDFTIPVTGQQVKKYRMKLVDYGDEAAMNKFDDRIDRLYAAFSNPKRLENYLKIVRTETPTGYQPGQQGVVATFINSENVPVATLKKTTDGNNLQYELSVDLPSRNVTNVFFAVVGDGILRINFRAEKEIRELGFGKEILQDAVRYFQERGVQVRTIDIACPTEGETAVEIWKDVAPIMAAIQKGTPEQAFTTTTGKIASDAGFDRVGMIGNKSSTTARRIIFWNGDDNGIFRILTEEILSSGGHSGKAKPSRANNPTARPDGIGSDLGNGKDQENYVAAELARYGYHTVQNVIIPGSTREPDLLIEGRIFDVYTPTSSDVVNIRNQIYRKVDEGQANRIVMNLQNSDVNLDALESYLKSKKIKGLREIIVIGRGDGGPRHFYPFDNTPPKTDGSASLPSNNAASGEEPVVSVTAPPQYLTGGLDPRLLRVNLNPAQREMRSGKLSDLLYDGKIIGSVEKRSQGNSIQYTLRYEVPGTGKVSNNVIEPVLQQDVLEFDYDIDPSTRDIFKASKLFENITDDAIKQFSGDPRLQSVAINFTQMDSDPLEIVEELADYRVNRQELTPEESVRQLKIYQTFFYTGFTEMTIHEDVLNISIPVRIIFKRPALNAGNNGENGGSNGNGSRDSNNGNVPPEGNNNGGNGNSNNNNNNGSAADGDEFNDYSPAFIYLKNHNYDPTQPGIVGRFLTKDKQLVGFLSKTIEGTDVIRYSFQLIASPPVNTPLLTPQVQLSNGIIRVDFTTDPRIAELGLGKAVLNDAIDYYTQTRQPLSGFSVTWSRAANLSFESSKDLDVYMAMRLSGLPREDAAFRTERGKLAEDLHFTLVKIQELDGATVDVEFRRPGAQADNPLFNDAVSKQGLVQDALRRFSNTAADGSVLMLVSRLTEELRGDVSWLMRVFNMVKAPAGTNVGASGRDYPVTLYVSREAIEFDREVLEIIYLNTESERRKFELFIRDGEFIVESHSVEKDKEYDFVMTEKGNIYILPFGENTNYRHSSIMAGGGVVSAGKIKLSNGQIWLKNHSGHYKPQDTSTFRHVIGELAARGIDLNSFRIEKYKYDK